MRFKDLNNFCKKLYTSCCEIQYDPKKVAKEKKGTSSLNIHGETKPQGPIYFTNHISNQHLYHQLYILHAFFINSYIEI